MTVIAFDGVTLAADKASTNCGYANTVTKIHRVPGGLVGLSGDGDAAMDLLAWFKGGRSGEYPKCQSGENRGSAIFVDEHGQVWMYDKTVNGMPYESRYYAMGSGRDYALAAMHLGFDARRAVEVACELDNDCGRGIDTLNVQTDEELGAIEREHFGDPEKGTGIYAPRVVVKPNIPPSNHVWIARGRKCSDATPKFQDLYFTAEMLPEILNSGEYEEIDPGGNLPEPLKKVILEWNSQQAKRLR